MKQILTDKTKTLMGIKSEVKKLREGTFITLDITNPEISTEAVEKDKLNGMPCLYVVDPESYWTDWKYGFFNGFLTEDNNKSQQVADAFDEIIAACKGKDMGIFYFNK